MTTRRMILVVLSAFVVAGPSVAAAAPKETAAFKDTAGLDTGAIEAMTGAKGAFDAKEGVFKVTLPRSDIKATAGGVRMTPPLGLDA